MSAFIIKVKTDNTGTSNSDQFTLPGNSLYSYNFDVDWGDGSPVETINSGSSWTHTFTGGSGTYSVEITENVAGGFPTIYVNNGGDRLKLLEIEQWGTNRWDTFSQSFNGCSNLTITATDEATADTGGVTNFGSSFYNCSSLTSFPLIDTSSGTTFFQAWRNCSSLASFALIQTSSGTNFFRTWRDCSSLTSFPLIDTSSGTDFRETWRGCSSLTSFPTLDFRNMLLGAEAFLNVTLDTASYDAILANSFANNVNNNVTFHGGNSKYARSGLAARDILTAAPRSWTITDGGYDSVYDPLGGVKGWWCPSRDTAGNGTTTLTDLSGNGNNGTLTNMDAATDWVADTDNGGVRALDFDGSSQRVVMGNAGLPLTGDLTLSFWFLYRSTASIQGVLSQYTAGTPGRTVAAINQSIGGGLDPNRLNLFSSFPNGLDANLLLSGTDTYNHIVLRRSGSQGTVYVNGVLAVTDTDWSTAIQDTPFVLGAFDSSGLLSFDGRIDATAIWDRALTPAEVSQLYNGGRSLNLLSTGTTQSIVPQLLLRRHRMSGGLVI